ncbi:MAG: TIGR04013 family B12-binding domain/radical SAM domain-containing protein [Candidatus Thorarchaeota archaeon]
MVNNKSIAIAFDLQKKNFYSITPLVATIDEDEDLDDLDVLLLENIDSKEIKILLRKYNRIVIAFSFRTAQLETIYQKMKILHSSLKKEDLERITFIAGGSHPSGDPHTTLKIGFDFAFIGEAEFSLPFFLKQHIARNDVYSTPGIAFLDESKIGFTSTSKPPEINLDDYPFISRERGLYSPLEISRGCAFGCTYCQVPTLFQHRVRHRSPKIIIDTVKWMVQKNLTDIRFITPNSFGYMSTKPREVNKEAILYLLQSLKSVPGIRDVYFGTFPGEVRPETVSEELVNEIKKYVSNNRISIGLQSGSNEVLRRIRRGHTVEEGVEAINILIKSGFDPVVDIIIGIPDSTEQEELMTIDLINNLTRKGATIRAHVFMPLPGTALENTRYVPVSQKVRKRLGTLSSSGKIEGNWSEQERYAKEAWEIIEKISNLPPLRKVNNR